MENAITVKSNLLPYKGHIPALGNGVMCDLKYTDSATGAGSLQRWMLSLVMSQH